MNNPFSKFFNKNKDRRNTGVRNLFDAVRPISLDEDEKAKIRMTLNAFTLRYPARNEAVHAKTADRISYFFRALRLTPTFVAIIGILVIGGTLSASAENALPGNALYPIKLAVNERVRGLFISSGENKAAWNIELATRRLDEAETLASRGRLDSKARASLVANLDTYSNALFEQTSKMAENNNIAAAVAASTRYEASLRTHGNFLSSFVNKANASAPINTELGALETAINNSVSAAAANQTEAHMHLLTQSNTASYDNFDAQMALTAAKSVQEASLLVANRKALLGSDAALTAETKLVSATEALKRGIEASKVSTLSGQSLAAYQQAIREAEEAKLLITLYVNFEATSQ
jgi:hypothetical protein